MKICSVALLLVSVGSAAAFSPAAPSTAVAAATASSSALFNYLDALGEVNPEDDVEEEKTREELNLKKEDVKNYGVGSWDSYVDFGDEFDGGDGQMGVAGDGDKTLEKFDMSQVVKSRSMSAKNAWGTSTGYADELVKKGVDQQRAQQLENWNNQQEVLKRRQGQRYMTEDFDQVAQETDEDWRTLAKFGVERNQDFDLDDEFGAVAPGDLTAEVQLTARMNGPAAVHEFALRNEYMGFADFRAAFTPETSAEWSIEPKEGSLMQREDTKFILKYKPNAPGTSEGYLVVETEDFKKTYKLLGSTQ